MATSTSYAAKTLSAAVQQPDYTVKHAKTDLQDVQGHFSGFPVSVAQTSSIYMLLAGTCGSLGMPALSAFCIPGAAIVCFSVPYLIVKKAPGAARYLNNWCFSKKPATCSLYKTLRKQSRDLLNINSLSKFISNISITALFGVTGYTIGSMLHHSNPSHPWYIDTRDTAIPIDILLRVAGFVWLAVFQICEIGRSAASGRVSALLDQQGREITRLAEESKDKDELETKNTELLSAIKELEQSLGMKEGEETTPQGIKNQIQALQSETETARKTIDQINKESRSLKEKVEQLESVKKIVSDMLELQKSITSTEVDKEILAAHRDSEIKRSEMQRQVDDLLTENKLLEERIKELLLQFDALETQFKECQETKETALSQKHHLQAAADKRESKLNEFRQVLKSSRDAYKKLQDVCNELCVEINLLKESQKQTEVQGEELDALSNVCKTKAVEARDEKARLEKYIAESESIRTANEQSSKALIGGGSSNYQKPS